MPSQVAALERYCWFLLSMLILAGCNADVSKPDVKGRWEELQSRWKAASPQERRGMADAGAFYAEFKNARKTRIREVLGAPDFAGSKYGMDIMRYNLGTDSEILDGLPLYIEFQFERGKVVAVLGNFLSE